MHSRVALTLFVLLFALLLSGRGEATTSAHTHPRTDGLNAEESARIAHAMEIIMDLVDRYMSEYQTDELIAIPMIYEGLDHLEDRAPAEALASFTEAETRIEAGAGPFAPRLMPAIQGQALSYIGLRDFDNAVDALHRAQHITRRYSGVSSTNELAILNQLIELGERTGNSDDVHTLRKLNLKVLEDTFGEDDPRVLPALLKLAEHLTDLAGGIRTTTGKGANYRHSNTSGPEVRKDRMFDLSEDLYERGILIIEQHYGPADPRLIPLLEGIVRSKLIKGLGKGKAIRAQQRIIDIIRGDPGSDVGDVARAMVTLGDTLILWDDANAVATYKAAWAAIPPEASFDRLRNELFGRPVKLNPRTEIPLKLRKRPWRTEGETYAEIVYRVHGNGRPTGFDIIETTAPPRANRYLLGKLYEARFRPRMVDGEVVVTEGLIWHQDYGLY